MRTIFGRAGWAVAGALALAIVAMVARGAAGGPLDPPGTPGPTDGVRAPGTPITSLPYTISSGGYYYVTRNLSSNGNGISIAADGVTLDLGGFRLTGFSQTGTAIGTTDVMDVVIRNGSLNNWGLGINTNAALSVTISDVSLTQNAQAASITNTVLERCQVRLGSGGGVTVDHGVVRDCSFVKNAGNGIAAQADAVIEGDYFDGNGYTADGFWDIAVLGTNVLVRDNYSHAFSGTRSPFVGVFPGASGAAILHNRYSCSPGIINNASGYVPAVPTTDGNICF